MQRADQPLSPSDALLARQRAYELFARLFGHGINAELLERVKETAELDAALKALGAAGSLTELAAEHQRLFAREIFPFEGVCCDPSALVGAGCRPLIALYRRAQFDEWKKADAVDHLATELLFASFLCAQERLASDDEARAGWQGLQRELLAAHLLRWLPMVIVALDRHGNDFFRVLGKLMLAVIVDHFESLRMDEASAQPAAAEEAPPDLEDERTKLAEIVDFLLAPSRAGLLICAADIAALGRRFHLPRGFGSRKQSLTTLIRSAADYEQIEALMDALRQLCAEWVSSYDALVEEHPSLTPFVEPVRARANATYELASVIVSRIAREAADG